MTRKWYCNDCGAERSDVEEIGHPAMFGGGPTCGTSTWPKDADKWEP